MPKKFSYNRVKILYLKLLTCMSNIYKCEKSEAKAY